MCATCAAATGVSGAAGGRCGGRLWFPAAGGAVRLGALNLYRDQPGDLTDDEHAAALVVADVRTHAFAAGTRLPEVAADVMAGRLRFDTHDDMGGER